MTTLTDPSVSAGPGTEQTNLSVADILRQAADLIDKVGLWRGRGDGIRDARQCAYTAIWEVTGGAHVAAAQIALRKHLRLGTPGDVFRWNDAASSAEVVTSQLRQAADAVDGRVPR